MRDAGDQRRARVAAVGGDLDETLELADVHWPVMPIR